MHDLNLDNLWRSAQEHVRVAARAYQITKRLRYFSRGFGRPLDHALGADGVTLLELRDFSAAGPENSARFAEQVFTRNRLSIISLQSRGLIARVEGSGILWRVTKGGLELAEAVEPIVREVCTYS